MSLRQRMLLVFWGSIFGLGLPSLVWSTTEVFKTIDPDGHVQYSARPSPQAESIKLPSAVRDPELEQRMDLWKRYNKARGEESEQRKAAAKEAKKKQQQRQEQCRQARQRLEQVSTARYLFEQVKGGERHVLGFEERKQREAEMKKEVERICNQRP